MRYLRQNALGLVAIFIALGGSAYAASKLPANSVGTKQLKKGAVTAAKVKGTLPSAHRADEASNALALGGLSASAFQRRINGNCPASAAIDQVNGDGSVGCQPLPVPSTAGFVVDASGGPIPVSEGETSIPLSGDTTWTAPPNQVGLLMVEAKMKLATKIEDLTPPPFEECRPFVRILDNGRPVTGTTEAISSSTPGSVTLTDYLAFGGDTPIGLVDPGSSHTIAAAQENGGFATEGCAAGSTIEDVRVVVVPLG